MTTMTDDGSLRERIDEDDQDYRAWVDRRLQARVDYEAALDRRRTLYLVCGVLVVAVIVIVVLVTGYGG